MKKTNNHEMEVKSLNFPEETREFDKGKLELVNVGGAIVGRAVFSPDGSGLNRLNPLLRRKVAKPLIFNIMFLEP